ncbi:hypothetical protein IQ06DRAFT_223842 [Phaeosphaeriaceae sp. SRC1lsM3a]|nr:hypothetical protein IQ06DRAFT_223842 [Stagonospora sp. SRC1lsM3a]
MSGAFETAAGAFAVVGVADVLIRTGRDLYRFLHDISDAPDEIVRLRDVIKEMIYLHEASVKCQNDLRARGAAVGNDTALRSLESASGALSRALQSLKLLVSKFKGAKTWSRVKFVLDESKVKKVISALEQAKVLLANALTLACCEFSALSNANIVTMVRASFDKAGVENKNLLESLETRLDAQFQNVLTTHGQNQKELLAKFDENQHQTLAKQASINQAIFSVQKMEMDNWKHQHTKMRQLGRDQKQTSASIQSLNQTVAKAADLDSLSALLKKSLSISHRARQSEQKGRYISFLGESPDQIMAYLLPFQDNINFAIDYAISQYRDEVSIDDAEWLRSEFEHLIGSASQELALQYRNSTATSLDHWSYPEDKVGVFKSAKRKRKGPLAWAPPTTLQHDDYHRPESLSRKCAKYSQQDILVPTARGEVTISLPNRRKPIKAPRGLDEVALYYTAEQIRSKFQIRARFLRDLQHARQPRICAHLNVFVEVENIIEVYVELMENGSLVEIDDALRKGTISPFHNDSGGYNFLLFVSIYIR